MGYSLLTIDNFYSNPLEVRDFALQQEFNTSGNFPGTRTQSFITEGVKDYIESHMREQHGAVIMNMDQEDPNNYNGAYQYTTQKDRSWIHADETQWAGVLYLTPEAPLSGGTSLYKHIPTGQSSMPLLSNGAVNRALLGEIQLDAQDITKWQQTAFIGNVFNRLVIYKADQFHSSVDYFGRDINDGRLFQTFFFDTEY